MVLATAVSPVMAPRYRLPFLDLAFPSRLPEELSSGVRPAVTIYCADFDDPHDVCLLVSGAGGPRGSPRRRRPGSRTTVNAWNADSGQRRTRGPYVRCEGRDRSCAVGGGLPGWLIRVGGGLPDGGFWLAPRRPGNRGSGPWRSGRETIPLANFRLAITTPVRPAIT
jgi:hypothetical protein